MIKVRQLETAGSRIFFTCPAPVASSSSSQRWGLGQRKSPRCLCLCTCLHPLAVSRNHCPLVHGLRRSTALLCVQEAQVASAVHHLQMRAKYVANVLALWQRVPQLPLPKIPSLRCHRPIGYCKTQSCRGLNTAGRSVCKDSPTSLLQGDIGIKIPALLDHARSSISGHPPALVTAGDPPPSLQQRW